MLILLDYLPIVAFFGTYVATKDFFTATAVLMAVMPLVLLGSWLATRKINRVHLISTVLVLLLGAVTLIVRDSLFLAWKPTVFNWLLGVVALGSLVTGGRTLMEVLLGKSIELEKNQWKQLTIAWGLFFFVVGAINLFVYYTYSEETWVYFKLWGLLGLTFAFAIAQSVWVGFMVRDNDSGTVTPGGDPE